jgi:hypothetical protein
MLWSLRIFSCFLYRIYGDLAIWENLKRPFFGAPRSRLLAPGIR